ncbi:MAG: GxxExxY protein [Muribaculaceae bacterium]|nr:GxxExxY protein [Muribaculaceae bacterium]MDE6787453.1 GxxExxY protein [Muribaculaceae bacterium]
MTREELNSLYHAIIDTAIIVHKRLGPGLLESIYRKVLAYELHKMGLNVLMEVPMRCIYDGIDMGIAYRADIVVEDEIIIEVKSTEQNHPVFYKQLLSYLKVADKRLGILLNFSYPILTDGLKRIVYKF